MKAKNFIILAILAISNNSCEDVLTDSDPKDIVQQLEGVWQCDEESSIFKSVLHIYQVYITPSPNDSTSVLIGDFYDLGENVEAVASVNSNKSITLFRQTLSGGYSVRGSGTISSNLKEIAWTYYIDDGSGEEDEVNATYTFQY